jgi:hypothetical protein
MGMSSAGYAESYLNGLVFMRKGSKQELTGNPFYRFFA